MFVVPNEGDCYGEAIKIIAGISSHGDYCRLLEGHKTVKTIQAAIDGCSPDKSFLHPGQHLPKIC